MTVHALRHTCAAPLIAQGVPVTQGASSLVRAPPEIKLEIFAHRFDDEPSRSGGDGLAAAVRNGRGSKTMVAGGV